MEQTQNITLSLPKDILRKAKILAIRRNTSLSGLLSETLAEMVERDESYQQASRRNLLLLKNGLDLGTQGNLNIQREELHERQSGR